MPQPLRYPQRGFLLVGTALASCFACADTGSSSLVTVAADTSDSAGSGLTEPDITGDADNSPADIDPSDIDPSDIDPFDTDDGSQSGTDTEQTADTRDAGRTDTSDADEVTEGRDGNADTEADDGDVQDDGNPGEDDDVDVAADTSDGRTPCPAVLPDEERGLIPTDGEPAPWTAAPCTNDLHVLVAPVGTRWTVTVDGLADEVTVEAMTPHRLPPRREAGESTLVGGTTTDGSVSLSVEPAHSGEVAVVIPGTDEPTEYTISARCEEGCERETTRYPVALLHGYAGTDSYFGVLDYFFGIDRLLSDRGYELLAPTTSPIATSENRADQLAEQLSEWMATTGARRANLVAHSQGGLDARLLVSGKGWSDRVGSITTIATPHRGIPLLLAGFLSVQDFSPDYMDVFNVAYPDVPGVRYWSWSSRSCGILEPFCIARNNGEVVDVLLGASYTLLLRFGPNDGIVPTASMLWGEHLGQLSADHFDEVGQIADLSLPGDPFRHRDFYLSEARRLAAAGL
jgi:triacylglycerol lipase